MEGIEEVEEVFFPGAHDHFFLGVKEKGKGAGEKNHAVCSEAFEVEQGKEGQTLKKVTIPQEVEDTDGDYAVFPIVHSDAPGHKGKGIKDQEVCHQRKQVGLTLLFQFLHKKEHRGTDDEEPKDVLVRKIKESRGGEHVVHHGIVGDFRKEGEDEETKKKVLSTFRLFKALHKEKNIKGEGDASDSPGQVVPKGVPGPKSVVVVSQGQVIDEHGDGGDPLYHPAV